MVALILFPLVGLATALVLRVPLPRSIAARVALVFLLGVGMHGGRQYEYGYGKLAGAGVRRLRYAVDNSH